MKLTQFVKEQGEHIDALYDRVYVDFVRQIVWEYKYEDHKDLIKRWDIREFKHYVEMRYDL